MCVVRRVVGLAELAATQRRVSGFFFVIVAIKNVRSCSSLVSYVVYCFFFLQPALYNRVTPIFIQLYIARVRVQALGHVTTPLRSHFPHLDMFRSRDQFHAIPPNDSVSVLRVYKITTDTHIPSQHFLIEINVSYLSVAASWTVPSFSPGSIAPSVFVQSLLVHAEVCERDPAAKNGFILEMTPPSVLKACAWGLAIRTNGRLRLT